MYSIEWSTVLSRAPRASSATVGECVDKKRDAKPARSSVTGLGRTVWALGFTSLLTDISSEMISSILPLYLVLHLGMSPLMFGMVDGIYQGAAVIVRLLAGVSADRWDCHKGIAAFGYGLSAICRLLILAAGNVWGAIAAVVALDRIGKGIRTAPRDALIARRSSASQLSTAFGVHRALDAIGAMLGPVIAFAMLAAMPAKFDVLFVTSLAIALVGLGVIILFVPANCPQDRKTGVNTISIKKALKLLSETQFRAQVLASIILGLATISDSFIFLILQKRSDLPATAFPLLYVGTSLATALFSVPCGRFADRFGRAKVLIGGYTFLAAVYLILLLPVSSGLAPLVITVLCFGIYYAATDGVLTAMAASVLRDEQSGTGLAVLATAMNLARLSGSVIFGVLWTRAGAHLATTVFLLALVASIAITVRLLSSFTSHAVQTSTYGV